MMLQACGTVRHMDAQPDDLIRLAYRSSLRTGVSAKVIADIVRTSDARNRATSITGMLALDGTRVCQILEGPHDVVVALYHAIEQDERHQGVVELSRTPIATRAYKSWGMTMRSMAEAAMVAFAA